MIKIHGFDREARSHAESQHDITLAWFYMQHFRCSDCNTVKTSLPVYVLWWLYIPHRLSFHRALSKYLCIRRFTRCDAWLRSQVSITSNTQEVRSNRSWDTRREGESQSLKWKSDQILFGCQCYSNLNKHSGATIQLQCTISGDLHQIFPYGKGNWVWVGLMALLGVNNLHSESAQWIYCLVLSYYL
jgi:hypothetical protein